MKVSYHPPSVSKPAVRHTPRSHLSSVIEQGASAPTRRVTNVEPWPRGALARALARTEKEWEKAEAAATRARPAPRWED